RAPTIPVVHASAEVADLLLGKGKLLEWQQSLDHYLAGSPKKLPNARVRLKVALHNESMRVQDVVAQKRGSDPKLADEWIVIGAHYDHLGVDELGRIYHGADDNGSGTSCLLEVGRVLGAADVTFKRSILLIHFAGEEEGLLGSTAFCKHPLVPAAQTVAMLNMD